VLFTLVKACKGVVIKEKFEMNLLQYWTAPKKLRISIILFGSGHFTITSILEGLIFNCPPPTI
jgi:hypothetical protein